MIKENFHEKITLALSLLILNNYLFLSLNFSLLLLKINFIFFLIVIIVFYFKNIPENFYLKIFFLFIIFIALGTPTSEWDARSIWLFHAKRIFYDSSIFSISDNYAAFSHNEYPSLAPAFASSLAVLIGHWNEVFPKISFSLIFLHTLSAIIKSSSVSISNNSILFEIVNKFTFCQFQYLPYLKK